MNMADILVLLAVGTAIVIAVVILRKNRKSGKSSCGCDCSHCSQSCKKHEGTGT